MSHKVDSSVDVDASIVASNIKREIEKMGVSYRKLGTMYGCSRQYISSITKKGVTNIKTINKLAQIFGCTTTDLLRSK